MALVAFIRCYDFMGRIDKAKTGDQLPEWFKEHVSIPYRDLRKPHSVVVPGGLSLGGEAVSADCIFHPTLGIIEFVLLMPMDDKELQSRLDGDILATYLQDTDPSRATPSSTDEADYLPQNVIDRLFRQATGKSWSASAVLTTGFTVVAVVHDTNWTPLTESSEVRIPELGDHQMARLDISHHHCVAMVHEHEAIVANHLSRLVVSACRINRSRHLEKRVLARIDQALVDMNGPTRNPWNEIDRVEDVQRQSLLFQIELGTSRYYRDEAGKSIHNALDDRIGITSRSLTRIDSSVAMFGSLVTSFIGEGLAQSQRRFAWFGAVFALLSVAYAGFAITDLVQAQDPSVRLWFLFALSIVVVAVLVAWLASRRPPRRQRTK